MNPSASRSASLLTQVVSEEAARALAGKGGKGDQPGEAALRAWRKRLFWKLQLLGWGGTALMGMAFATAGYLALRDAVLVTPVRSLLGIAVTCGMRYAFARLRPAPWGLWSKVAVVFFGCGVISFADSGLIWLLSEHLGIDPGQGIRHFLKTSVLMRWMFYWLWSVLYFGINYWLDTEHAQLRLARMEATARASELQVLRAQVNPHFLFNALNSIMAEAQDPVAVLALTQALSDYLRFSLLQRGDVHSLGVELNALENYLRVEKARFEENLEYEIKADARARRTPIPIALVQTLLDNAIKYGQRSGIRPLRVVITAERAGGFLSLSVFNTGGWIVASSATTGTGLVNLRRRLDLLYGEAASLVTEPCEGAVRVSVSLPVSKERGRPE